MAATITWKVGTMECYPSYQQEKDVVFTVHWDCLGSETINNTTYNGRVYGSTGVTYHSGSSFTPYNQLTQQQVLDWVWDAIGQEQKTSYENAVISQINNQITPPVIILPLPWLPPIITQQPTNQSVTTGSSVTFTVIATSSSTLSYQWIKDNTNIIDATNSTYTITNVQDSDAGDYKVVVSSDNSTSITSSTATLTIIQPTPPEPIVPPVDPTTP